MSYVSKVIWRSGGLPVPPAPGPTFTCPAAADLGDAVYLIGTNDVDLALADVGGTPAIGVVSEKPTATTCRVVASGVVSFYAGLVPGARYWLSATNAGKLAAIAPQGAGQFAQMIGVAASATRLWASVDPTPIGI
jgi:hypothetical protein